MIIISFPFDEILCLIAVFSLANDRFDFVFWLVIDDHGWRWFLSAVRKKVAVIFAVWFEEGRVECGVDVHLVWQSEFERVVTEFGCDRKGSFPSVCEFPRSAVSWVKVSIIEHDEISYFELMFPVMLIRVFLLVVL